MESIVAKTCLRKRIARSTFYIILAAITLLPNLSCAEPPFTPFAVPDIGTKEWLTPGGPSKEELAGRVYVIEFWATWCPTCKTSVKHLQEIQEKYARQGLVILALSQDDNPAKVRTFVAEKGIKYHVAMDAGSSADFNVKYIPTVFVVDSTGQVVWKGYPWEAGFEKAIQNALKHAPPPITGGISLGVYERYKKSLLGGADFASAYRQINADAMKAGSPDAAAAARIISAIDSSIARRTRQALLLSEKDPMAARQLLVELLDNFGGIPAAQLAAKHLDSIKVG
jgi:thiol-disulfide isomerase/thioredoxin